MSQAETKQTKTKKKSKQQQQQQQQQPQQQLPAHLEEIKTKVSIGSKGVYHTQAIEDPSAFTAMGVDNSLDIDHIKQHMKINIIEHTDNVIVFDLIGVDAPIANALRRILIAEIPTMAIEKVVIYQNTSIIQDEVLAHRLGLIPIQVDPRLFKTMAECDNKQSDENTISFTLQATCFVNPKAPESAPLPQRYLNSTIYSKDLKWVPQGSQAELFRDHPIKPIHDDIIIAKLRPGQTIEAELFCEKGVGQTHAKWSPVATAAYRLMPHISFNQPIQGELAEELVAKCPVNVFDIEDLGSQKQARVARPRDCTMCRECIREPGWEQRVNLRKVRDHFIFSVESVGMYKPHELVIEAIRILRKKCQTVAEQLP